jgi:hypothetical protein
MELDGRERLPGSLGVSLQRGCKILDFLVGIGTQDDPKCGLDEVEFVA